MEIREVLYKNNQKGMAKRKNQEYTWVPFIYEI